MRVVCLLHDTSYDESMRKPGDVCGDMSFGQTRPCQGICIPAVGEPWIYAAASLAILVHRLEEVDMRRLNMGAKEPDAMFIRLREIVEALKE